MHNTARVVHVPVRDRNPSTGRIRCGGSGLGSFATLGATLAVLCSPSSFSLSLVAFAFASASASASTSPTRSSTRSDLGRAPHSISNSNQDNCDRDYGYQDFNNNNNNNNDYHYSNDRVPWLAVGGSSSHSGTTQSSGTSTGTNAHANANTDEVARYEELPPTVFSPSGRLHPVEAAVRAGKLASDSNNNGNPMSNGLVAMRCRDGLVVVTTLALPLSLSLSLSLSPDEVRADLADASNRNENENEEEGVTTRDKDADGDNKGYPPSLPLFLFEETTRPTTATGPLWDIGPGMIGATAGNAVDNRILGEKLRDLAAEASALDGSLWDDDVHEQEQELERKNDSKDCNNNNNIENENENENDAFPVVASSGRLARDLANQLQVVTQDLAAAQKQKLGRMLASSAVVLGDGKIWRVDPTGQFWDCGAAVLGSDADRVEEKLCARLWEERDQRETTKRTREQERRPGAETDENQNNDDDGDETMDVGRILESLSLDRALELARDVLLRHHAGIHQRRPPLLGNPTLATAAAAASGNASERSGSSPGAPAPLENANANGNANANANPAPISRIYWEAAILDYSSPTRRRGRPRKLWKRGTFCVPNHNPRKE